MNDSTKQLKIIDSHTGGEPTRLIVDGAPDLGSGSMADRMAVLRDRHDWIRTSLVTEPRGSEVMIGALLCKPVDPANTAGVIFFNNVGYLGMCGHGTIGLMATLSYLGTITPGVHRLETTVGIVTTTVHDANRVSFENVPSYRHRRAVSIEVPGIGTVTGDAAWGGNWFFLVSEHGQTLELDNADSLLRYTRAVQRQADLEGLFGEEGGHVDLFGPSTTADSKNFVLCPGGEYDRSPCGTGTSAKLACLAADGKLAEGEVWRQESIVGSVFEGTYRRDGDKILPTITGSAYVNAETTMVISHDDPFAHGITP